MSLITKDNGVVVTRSCTHQRREVDSNNDSNIDSKTDSNPKRGSVVSKSIAQKRTSV